jgi:hypothetical protein
VGSGETIMNKAQKLLISFAVLVFNCMAMAQITVLAPG